MVFRVSIQKPSRCKLGFSQVGLSYRPILSRKIGLINKEVSLQNDRITRNLPFRTIDIAWHEMHV